MRTLFGTDGIRGIPGEFPLDHRTLHWIGRTLGEYLAGEEATPRVLIGMDTRESSPTIAQRIAEGLASGGAEPVSAGVITTPGVAWLTKNEGFSAGVVISASHNPYHDNGVKVIARTGMKLADEIEEQLEPDILSRAGLDVSPDLPEASGGASAVEVERPFEPRYAEDYLNFLRSRLPGGVFLRGLKIVLDCAHGAASALAPQLFSSLGAEVIAIAHEPNGRNINDGCGALHPEKLAAKVVEAGAQLGVAFDGDADRAIFADRRGNIVNGDGTLLVAARRMKARGELKGRVVVGTVMANLGLERALEREGLKLKRTPVGDKYVLEEMLRCGANLGGEQAGHIIFLDDSTAGDGMLTALKIVGMMLGANRALDEMAGDLKIFPQKLVNVRVREKKPFDQLPAVSRVLKEAEAALEQSGRVLLRYSGTEGLARVMVEAETQELVDRWTAALTAAIESALGA